MKIINNLFFISLLCLLIACGGDSGSSTATTEPIEDVNGFAAFYEKFHSDSIFQMEHIRFPLEGVPSVANTTYDGTSTFYWQKDNWSMHRPIDLSTGEFTREFDMSPIMVEERITNAQKFRLVRRFYYSNNEWALIYYADLNPTK